MFMTLFGNGKIALTNNLECVEVLVIMSLVLIWQVYMKFRYLENVIKPLNWFIRSLLITTMCVSILLVEGGESRAYIYFQF